MTDDFKRAYERQKLAREQAEKLLEDKSRELYQSNEYLKQAYEKLKQQKLQLIHQEKLASIGQLSAGVAHEINNPIGFVSTNLETLKKYSSMLNDFFESFSTIKDVQEIQKLKDNLDIDFIIEDIDELIGDCLDGTKRISEIVKGLKNFSRNEKNEIQEFSINECIESTLKLVKSEVKYNAELILNLEDEKFVLGNQSNFSQVLLNLIMNASYAIENRNQHEEDGSINIATQTKQNELMIKVQDNGSGISEENLKQIFDPFFTTKPVGKGTGLGLSISQSIVRKMGGELEVESQIDVGTTFTITLPMATP